MWFPKPKTAADIQIIGPGGGLSEQDIFHLLHRSDAVEWKEKVGVVTPADGSAKASTRLLKSGKWVFKTDNNRTSAHRGELRAKLYQLAILAVRLDLWHPEKLWFLMEVDGEWWPVSVCPRLTSIRTIADWDTRLRWWTRMILFGLRLSLDEGIGLDLNPSNFAFDDPGSDHLYYLDDEYYSAHECFDVAEAVVARLPEDANIEPERWQEWGSQLYAAIQTICPDQHHWQHFVEGIQNYPLTLMLDPHRNALLRGLEGKTPASAPRVITQQARQTDTLTCVFGDVHGNLPALEAVLKEAKKQGADSYVFLGDAVSYGPFPGECIDVLGNMENILYLRGNHDHTVGSGIPENGSNRMAKEVDMWSHQHINQTQRDWLLSLPVEYADDEWLLVHGAPQDPRRFYGYIYELTYRDNLSYLEAQGKSACFYGHTHVQFMYHRFADGRDDKFVPTEVTLFQPGERLLLNPGSVGQPRDGDPRAAFALWDRIQNIVRFYRVGYPVSVTVQAVQKAGLPEDLIYRLEVGR